MNPLLEKVIERRKGHYCHVVEVSTVYELEVIAEAIVSENKNDFSIEVITEFLETLDIYYLAEEEENEQEREAIYNFSFTEYINNNF